MITKRKKRRRSTAVSTERRTEHLFEGNGRGRGRGREIVEISGHGKVRGDVVM